MSLYRESGILQCLRRVAILRDADNLDDDALLRQFAVERDHAAMELLVERHGPMVWSVCRRLLGNSHDAEDAFQATFIVLVRRASCVRGRGMLAGWLHGVARNTALKARAVAARRRAREIQATGLPEAAAKEESDWRDIRPILDRELSRLPENYRAAIVLCDLEEKSRKETAKQLGVPEGTLSGWLTRGRTMLARRLARHGLSISGGTLAAMLSTQVSSASVPSTVFSSTIQAADFLTASRATALAEGVIQAMFVNKLKLMAAALIVLATLGAGVGRLTRVAEANGQVPATKKQSPADRLRQAAAELEAARAALQQAEAAAAVAKARVAQKEAELRQARQQLNGDETKSESNAKAVAALANQFKYRVPFEVGFTETTDGGSIEILEVWGTQPKIMIGGIYLVRGKYRLSSQQHAKIYFYETAKDWDNSGPTLDLQTIEVSKGEGEFTLMHAMPGPGYFHLWFACRDDGKGGTIANVYFGTGDNVLRK